MVSRALRILVVSEDRQHLRDCYDFFVACGYEVETRCGSGSRPRNGQHLPDLAIYDFTSAHPFSCPPGTFKIAVVEANSAASVRQAIAEGADDVVLRPATPAKLLVRIRAAASNLEASATVARQYGRNPSHTYPGEGAFLGTIQHWIDRIPQDGQDVAAALFAVLAETHEAYLQWLQDIEASLLPDSKLFELSGGRVAVATPSVLPEQMLQWTNERVLSTPSLTDTTHADQPALLVSASLVSTRDETTSSEQFALLLTDRLNLALSLGQGVVVDESQENVWLPSHPERSIFDGMIAEDIMRPTTISLLDTDSVQSALEKMRCWNAEIAPVCSPDGQPTGLVRAEDLVSVENSQEPIAHHYPPNVPQVSYDATFEEFVALFSSHDSAWLQVVREKQPAGVIHCDDLTSMNSPVMVSLP